MALAIPERHPNTSKTWTHSFKEEGVPARSALVRNAHAVIQVTQRGPVGGISAAGTAPPSQSQSKAALRECGATATSTAGPRPHFHVLFVTVDIALPRLFALL